MGLSNYVAHSPVSGSDLHCLFLNDDTTAATALDSTFATLEGDPPRHRQESRTTKRTEDEDGTAWLTGCVATSPLAVTVRSGLTETLVLEDFAGSICFE